MFPISLQNFYRNKIAQISLGHSQDFCNWKELLRFKIKEDADCKYCGETLLTKEGVIMVKLNQKFLLHFHNSRDLILTNQ